MASRVISIKMDEKDVERLNTYHKALIEGGFILPKTLTLNGLYKHLLLDYLEEDLNQVFASYSDLGMTPKCFDPERLDEENRISISNTYNLSEAAFNDYKQCVKESLEQTVVSMEKSAMLFNKVLSSKVVVAKSDFYEMDCFEVKENDDENASFWTGKALEIMQQVEREFAENSIKSDIEMINKSSLPDELKEKIINEIEDYEKERKRNHKIVHGGRIYR